jgi:glycosyltransferase involved in cell wall biosynthesis
LKQALVVHPWFPIFGGGEYLCLSICQILQKEGYEVSIVSDTYNPEIVEQIYGMGEVLAKCKHIALPRFNPRRLVPRLNLYALQKLLWARKVRDEFQGLYADVIFATQPSWLRFHQKKRYDFTYNIRDLFSYPSLLFKFSPRTIRERHRQGIGGQWKLYFFFLSKARDLLIGKSDVRRFIALSNLIYQDLVENGFTNSEMMFPPARLDSFKPKPKKRQVVITCRIDPAKNLEDFFNIAQRLSGEKFLLVGRDNEATRKAHPGYVEGLLGNMPENVKFINSPLKQVPETIEESQVYLYTGIEPGVGISIMEACGAGCVPIAASIGGGSEVVDALGAGFKFTSLDDAVRKVKMALNDPPWTPGELRERALKAFSQEAFQNRIRELVS